MTGRWKKKQKTKQQLEAGLKVLNNDPFRWFQNASRASNWTAAITARWEIVAKPFAAALRIPTLSTAPTAPTQPATR